MSAYDKRFWRKTRDLNPKWTDGGVPPPLRGDADYEAMRSVYRDKMGQLFHMRAKLRGTQHGVSMPDYSFEDFWSDPEVLDCYIKIELFKLKKRAQKLRASRAQVQQDVPYFARTGFTGVQYDDYEDY